MTHKEMIIKTITQKNNLPQDLYEKLSTLVLDTYLETRDERVFKLRTMIDDRAKAVKEGDTERVKNCDNIMHLMSLMAKEAKDFDNHEIDEKDLIKFGLEDK